jgi:hypothetical protein
MIWLQIVDILEHFIQDYDISHVLFHINAFKGKIVIPS